MKVQFDSNEKYHSSPGISASGLKAIHKKSVYHFLNQKPFESSAMALGTAVHCAMLEPECIIKIFTLCRKLIAEQKPEKNNLKLNKKI